jgi:hypothetical protein
MLLFDRSSEGNSAAWSSLSAQTCDLRSARKQNIGFTQADRQRSARSKK